MKPHEIAQTIAELDPEELDALARELERRGLRVRIQPVIGTCHLDPRVAAQCPRLQTVLVLEAEHRKKLDAFERERLAERIAESVLRHAALMRERGA